MDDVYYVKYLKYKRKYIEAKEVARTHTTMSTIMNTDTITIQGGGKNAASLGGFYIIHNPFNPSNLLSILEDGYIYPGKMVDVKRRVYGGSEPLDYVYSNIYFDDLKNLDILSPIIIILKPDVVYSYNTYFNRGWFMSPSSDSIRIKKSDTKKEKIRKLKQIKEYVASPTYYKDSPIADWFTGVLAHELLFDSAISLKHHLLGVVFRGFDDKVTQQVRSVMTEKYGAAKLFDDVDTFVILRNRIRLSTKS